MNRPIRRTQFLRGDLSGGRQGIRPPWSKPEAVFTDVCERCGDCIQRCPEQILVKGYGGFPQVDFSLGACTFCHACVEACRYPVFESADAALVTPWQLEVSITQDCLSTRGIVCRSCADACERAAIRFQLQTRGRSIPHVLDSHCSGCGECFAVCPSQAISILPGQRDCAA
ncbi:MAG: ferredoxin-type protein NapF [Candidatus Thiodiazotropha sp.]